MDVAVVGAGRVGTAVAVLLAEAGHRVVAASGRQRSRERAARFLPDVPFRTPAEAASAADLVILGVPDDVIAPLCVEVAEAGGFRRGQAVIHLSGAMALDALASAASAGATLASLHPLRPFPSVEDAIDGMAGTAMAVTARSEEGHAVVERLARDLGGRPFRLEDRWKGLYHAAAVLSSNYVTVLMALGERLMRRAGVEDPAPLVGSLSEATVRNAIRLGPGAALTGPAARGDAGTLRRNLEALAADAPHAVAPYVALAGLAVELAGEDGRLDEEGRARIERELAAWR